MPPGPRLRQWDDGSPQYDGGEDIFKIVLEHDGLFCGHGRKLTYECAQFKFIDNCSTETWSLLWIEEILKLVGYEFDGKLHVYWCRPGKDINHEGGLQCIETDADIVDMINAAEHEKSLNMLVDHNNYPKIFKDDVVYSRGGPYLPDVLTPKKKARKEPIVEHCQNSVQGEEAHVSGEDRVLGEGEEAHVSSGDRIEREGEDDDMLSSDDGSADSIFADSDYDAEDGDDDLFADNVDRGINYYNEPEEINEVEDDAALDDLELTKEEEEKLNYIFKAFNPEVDMDNPVFRVGMVFNEVKELRDALAAYSIRNRVKLQKVRNEKKRFEAICKPGCTWKMKATADSRSGGLTIRTYDEKHTCQKTWEVVTLTAKFLKQRFMDEFRDNQKLDLDGFAKKVQREFNMCPSRWKLGRARKAALEEIHGDEDAQFSLLWDYGLELRKANPGSKFYLSTNKVNVTRGPSKDHLSSLYWSYSTCKKGFLKACRPFICVDGCHMKTKYKGQLLTAVGIDPNDCIYPIAFGLVEIECTSSWEWFLTTLKEDLNITNNSPFTIMSDKQKGLINVVQGVWPDTKHRFCVRHMCQNFQRAGHKGEVLKNDLWAIARSTDVPKWRANSDKMFKDNEEAYAWVEQLVPNTWIKAFYSVFPKCDMQLNNHSEVFNRYTLPHHLVFIIVNMLLIIYIFYVKPATSWKLEECQF